MVLKTHTTTRATGYLYDSETPREQYPTPSPNSEDQNAPIKAVEINQSQQSMTLYNVTCNHPFCVQVSCDALFLEKCFFYMLLFNYEFLAGANPIENFGYPVFNSRCQMKNGSMQSKLCDPGHKRCTYTLMIIDLYLFLQIRACPVAQVCT